MWGLGTGDLMHPLRECTHTLCVCVCCRSDPMATTSTASELGLPAQSSHAGTLMTTLFEPGAWIIEPGSHTLPASPARA